MNTSSGQLFGLIKGSCREDHRLAANQEPSPNLGHIVALVTVRCSRLDIPQDGVAKLGTCPAWCTSTLVMDLGVVLGR